MYFLASLKLSDVPGVIGNTFRSLCALLCELIYPAISKLYQTFTQMGFLFYNDTFSEIYNKISLVIGVFMVFRITFWLIEILISPDKITDKEKNPTKIIQKVLIAVVMLAITPTIFKTAFDLQYKIIENNIIPKIMAVGNVPDADEAGKFLAAELFSNFYNANDDIISSDCRVYTDDGFASVYDQIYQSDTLKINNECLVATEKLGDEEVYEIDFNGLFAVGVGAFVFWMILMYCINVGTRYVQLIYLQIIAPVPIMCYLTPNKDNMFSKWIKQCTTTYLDLFIRIAIINLVMVLSEILLKDDSLFNVTDNFWIKIFLILGLLTFAKKAPDLIQDLLPKGLAKASGDFGLSWKKRTDAMIGGKYVYGVSNPKRVVGFAAGGLAGAVVGGAMGVAGGKGVGSRLVGGLAGAGRGLATGSKKGNVIKNVKDVKKNQAAQNSRLQQWRINAGKGENEANRFEDWASRRADAFKKNMGFETDAKRNDRHISQSEGFVKSFKSGNEFATSKIVSQRAKGEGKEFIFQAKDKFGNIKDIDIAKLIADKDQAQQTYSNFDQNRKQIEASQRQLLLNKKKQELENSTPRVNIATMSKDEKIDRLASIYVNNGTNDIKMAREKAAEAVNNYNRDEKIDEAVNSEIEKQLNSERELSIQQSLNNYVETQLENDVETNVENAKQEAYTALRKAETQFSEYEDLGNFAFMATQIVNADGNQKYQEHYRNILAEYNDLVDSPANKELGLDLEKITEEDMRTALSDPEYMEKLSDIYKRAKGISDRITTFKREKEYNQSKANDQYNGK